MKKFTLSFLCLFLVLMGVTHAQLPQYTYTNNATGGNYIPFGVSLFPNYRSQFFYFPGDFSPSVPTSPGFITDIYFRCYTGYSTSGTVFNNMKISIGNTSVTSPTAYVSGLTPCYSNTYNLPSIAGGSWFKITLDNPVYVDLSQPLVIDVAIPSGSAGFPVFAGGTPVKSSVYTGNTHLYSSPSTSTSANGRRYSYQFGFDFFAGYPCTDTPKSLVNALSPVCPNKKFSISPATFYANATYKWQYSDNNGNSWVNHPSHVGSYGDITDVITAARMYRCIITCTATGLSYTTPAKKVDIAPFYYCYCDNANSTAAGLDIGNVTMNRLPEDVAILNNGIATPPLNNNTASKTYSTFQYTVAPVPIYRDSSFSLSVSEITSSSAMPAKTNVAAYIDYNRNGIFESAEKVMKTSITAVSTVPNTEKVTFTVPHNAEIGMTGMRVIMGTGNLDSCGSVTGEGEVEDYLVDIRYEPCKDAANPGDVKVSDSLMCKGYDYLTIDTTYEKYRSELVRTWQISADDIVWYNVAGSTNKDLLQNIYGGQQFFYRVRQICPRGNADTTYTKEQLVRSKDGYKCYCYSQAVGDDKDSTDVGGFSVGDYVINLGGPHLDNPQATKKRTDHTDDNAIDMYIDSTYKISVFETQRTDVHGDVKVTIFMDFNNNKQYDVPYERVYTGYTSISNFTLADTFTVPPIVITEVPTGMRVVMNSNMAPNDASDLGCGAYQSGETQDYMVVFHHKPFPAHVGEVEGISNFNMFPNPTTGKFHLQFNSSSATGKVAVTITNVTGQHVMQMEYDHKAGQFDKEIDMSKMARGVYFVELQSNGEKAMQKLVIE
ncbi:MAG: T9SS type A sorting domain-containing protein [Bacteroidetes bacterium]|nr:T9SS type A sorting domain-containing protein [Bacteroidota bacterium]